MNIFVNKKSQVRSGWKIASVLSAFYAAVLVVTFIMGFIYIIYQAVVNNLSQSDIINLGDTLETSLIDMTSGLGILVTILQCLVLIFFTV